LDLEKGKTFFIERIGITAATNQKEWPEKYSPLGVCSARKNGPVPNCQETRKFQECTSIEHETLREKPSNLCCHRRLQKKGGMISKNSKAPEEHRKRKESSQKLSGKGEIGAKGAYPLPLNGGAWEVSFLAIMICYQAKTETQLKGEPGSKFGATIRRRGGYRKLPPLKRREKGVYKMVW